MKICTVCNQPKSLEEFYNSKSYKDGKGYRCKSCDNLARRKYESEHRERKRHNQRRARRKWAYGITEDEFNRMVASQNNECAICSIPLSIHSGQSSQDNRLAIDHDHVTKKVCGLLCHRCNRGLGHFLDDPDLLRMAAEYLEEK